MKTWYVFALSIVASVFQVPGSQANETRRDVLGREVSDCRWGSANFLRASELQQRGDFVNAIRLYNEEINKEGSLADTNLYYERGEAYFQMKEYEKAIESYSVASSKNPTDYLASLQLAYCWYKLRDYKKARIDLRDSMKVSPTINARCLSGLLHAREGKNLEALAELKECCKKDNVSNLTPEQLAEAQKMIVILQRKK